MGFFKKIFKGIGKIWKSIGKRIKKAFKKVGKWFGKLGVFGQIALSFIPGIGPMLSGLFKGLGQGALAVLKKGLTATGLGSKVVRGASWLVDTARKVVGGVQKGFKTITSGATSFISNTTKYLGSKIPGVNKLINQAPETFFGTGGDSVLGRVGAEVTNNFNDFKDAIGGMLRGPEGRAALIEKDLATTKIGGVSVDTREKPFQDIDTKVTAERSGLDVVDDLTFQSQQANTLYNDLSSGIQKNLGSAAQSNFQKLYEGQYGGNAVDFLKAVQADPGFVNKWINQKPALVEKWFNFNKSGQGTNPFEKMKFPDPAAIDVEADEGFFSSFSLGSSGDGSSLLSQTGKSLRSSAANLPGSLFTSAVTQAAMGSNYSMPTQEVTNAVDTVSNQFIGVGRGTIGQSAMPTSPGFGLEGLSFDPYAFIANNMSLEGNNQGMYGVLAFPGFNYGMPQQPMAS